MLLCNAKVLTMEGPDLERGYVRVTGNVIVSVGDMADCPALLEGEERVDLTGKLLLPGFIDAHSHMGLYENGLGIEGDDINEDSDPATPHLRAIDGVNPLDPCFAEARQSGVTCVVISPGSANPIGGTICALKTAGRWVDKMAVSSALAMKFALGENPKMVYSAKSQGPCTRMATVAIIREQLYKAKRYLLDKHAAEGDPDLDEPDYDCRCEALIPVLRREMRAHFHAHRAYDILSAVRIAEEFHLDYTIIHCTEGHLIADILGELGARAVCGPLICARTKPELSGLISKNCLRLREAGVIMAIATDHPEVPVDFLASSATLAACEGLGAREALLAITLDAARAVGLETRLGSIAPGKDADLLVYDCDPLTLRARPAAVYIGGERVV